MKGMRIFIEMGRYIGVDAMFRAENARFKASIPTRCPEVDRE